MMKGGGREGEEKWTRGTKDVKKRGGGIRGEMEWTNR